MTIKQNVELTEMAKILAESINEFASDVSPFLTEEDYELFGRTAARLYRIHHEGVVSLTYSPSG